MEPSAIQKGMYLVNDGKGNIPVYNSEDATGTPELNVAPGQLIGQVVDVVSGTDYIYYLTSDAITANASTFQKIGNWVLGFLPGQPVVNVGAVRFADLNANVSQAQIDRQTAILANAAANGATLQNSIKAAAKTASDVVSSVATPFWWLGGGLLAYYLLTHSNIKTKSYSLKS